MQIFRESRASRLPAAASLGLGPTLVSVGNFDGVHRAHQMVLREMAARARELRAKSVAVTFHPHPLRVLRPQAALRLITPLEEKLKLLAVSGIDAAVVLDFTGEFSRMPARAFAERVLRDWLGAVEIHEGANFHFGHGAHGDVQQLAALGKELGFEATIYPELRIRGLVAASNQIRRLLIAGRVSAARALLGRAFGIHSVSAPGRGVGSKQTVPTINLAEYQELVPAHGVYITRTRLGIQKTDHCFDSVTNIGVRPTFGVESFAIESHLLHPPERPAPAGTEVEIFFLRRLRDERKFASAEELRGQILRDVARARRFFHLEQVLARPEAKPAAHAQKKGAIIASRPGGNKNN